VAKQRKMGDLAKTDVWLSKEKRVKSKKKMGGQVGSSPTGYDISVDSNLNISF
jgi:hypothetical protein